MSEGKVIPTTEDLVKRLVEAIRTREREDVRWHPNIYFLGDNIIAKRARSDRRANQELKMGKLAFESGVSIPETYDVVKLIGAEYFDRKVLSGTYLFRERTDGIPIGYLTNSREIRKAEEGYKEEISKVFDLGVIPLDANRRNNTLFNRESGKVHLIDPEFWCVKEEVEIHMRELCGVA